MTLAIFDLDNTLLAGDSDYLWGSFLVDRGLVDPLAYEAANTRFYEDYQMGKLDIDAFLNFALAPLSQHAMADLITLRQEFLDASILPILLPAARQLIKAHRAQGHTLMIITATNAFITAPIADLYEMDHLIATTPEIKDGRYTGRYVGEPCFQQGKVRRLQEWLHAHDASLANSWFYSDSHNDRPLLDLVCYPVAVDPDQALKTHAERNQWPVISLREKEAPASLIKRIIDLDPSI
ncbi:MAG: HAD family hydrolase [Methylococcaceae bacterium]